LRRRAAAQAAAATIAEGLPVAASAAVASLQALNNINQERNGLAMAGNQKSGNQNNSERGFASMDEDKQREIAKKGGESVPDEKRSFSQDSELASEAGRKGGQESGGNFKNDRERAAEAGRKGGESRGGR
jgi:general stress protein YciG